MQDLQPRDPNLVIGHDAAAVSHFASQVVSILADRTSRSATKMREPVVAGLIAASLAGTKDAFADLLSELRISRISLAALSDLYIPLAAARMGEDWEKDEMSWLEVSVGVSRLQSLVREIGSAWVADQAADSGFGSILLIVPDREQHTLGPMVAMGQMRRFGVSVCLRIAPTANELRSLVAARDFDGVMISVATQEKLESVAKTVKFLKSIVTKSTPIVVGGAVMAKVEDPAACTGADISSNDIGAALEAIGLEFDAFCVLRRA
jgi:MerR family transcriptional regulator, light-induced transcriptional regulator